MFALTYRYQAVCFQLFIVRPRKHSNFSAYMYFGIRWLILAGILKNGACNKKILMILLEEIYFLTWLAGYKHGHFCYENESQAR